MKKCYLLLLILTVGCAPTYMVPQSSPTATVKAEHLGEHPSSTSFDIFSFPKCEKQFYLGELADIGTNIDLKRSSISKIEANKTIYISGSRTWSVRGSNLESWCSLMFSFSPKENSVYSMKMIGENHGCTVEVIEEGSKEPAKDLKIYKIDKICIGDILYLEK